MAAKQPKAANQKRTTKTKGAKAKAKPVRARAQRVRLSQIDAAVRVLTEARKPMNCKAMVETMGAKGYWKSPGGKTPAATLYAAILRDLGKGKASRFKKVDRGQFALNG